MSEREVVPLGFFDGGWAGDGLFGAGSASTLHTWPDAVLPEREFPPGFHGANPGPSHPEVKPRYRVKAWTSKV